ncbi:MAG: nitroreductase family protein [Chitinivibrionia bacterium]|nr:nitroreductase family protein [Chitinivibrionia bacterium]
MEKPAQVEYPVHELIGRRWSPVAFSGRPLTGSDIASLFEAARWAPSSFNEQPWRFIVAARDDPEEFARMLSCLSPGNQAWVRHAPLVILTFAKLAFDRNGKPNRHALHDVGLAAENLVLQAMSMGLFAHQMAGFDSAKVVETYGVPGGFEPVTAIAVGYPGDADSLPEDLRRRQHSKRARVSLGSLVFTKVWGEPPDFLGA